MKSVKLSEVTGSLSEYARQGLREPVVVTEDGKPLLAVLPLTDLDDRESVSLATDPQFLEIIEQSRADVRRRGAIPLSEVRRRQTAGHARRAAQRPVDVRIKAGRAAPRTAASPVRLGLAGSVRGGTGRRRR